LQSRESGYDARRDVTNMDDDDDEDAVASCWVSDNIKAIRRDVINMVDDDDDAATSIRLNFTVFNHVAFNLIIRL